MSSCSKRNILFVVPSLRTGGAETQLVSLVNTIDGERFQKCLFSFDAGLDLRTRLEPDVEFVHQLRQRKLDLRVIRALAKTIDDRSIDAVHCTLQFALLMGWLAIRMSARKPALVVTVHTTINRNYKDELLDRVLYQWLMRACDKVVFVCETQKEHWIRKFPALRDKAVVVHNGVDSSYFSKARVQDRKTEFRQRYRIPEDAPLACAIAQFRPEKGHRELVKAFAQVSERLPAAHLALAGGGRLRDSIEQYVKKLNLQDRVRFLGPVADVRLLLGNVDILVMASVAVETFSIAMLESLAMGVPVVATDIGGTKEAVLHGKTGLLVPPNDTPALARAVGHLLADRELAHEYGSNGERIVRARFDRSVMARKTGALLADLVSKPSVRCRVERHER